MFLSPSSCLFMTSILISIVLVGSSPSFLTSWVGLELNTLSFVPLMLTVKGKLESESAIKYFLTQALASVMFLMGGILTDLQPLVSSIPNIMVLCALLIKLGAAPFHAWMPGIVMGLSWPSLFIILTVQKINPLVILWSSTPQHTMVSLTILCSLATGAIMGLSQTQTHKIMVFSSINHMGWILAASTMNLKLLVLYFVLYSTLVSGVISTLHQLNIFHLNQTLSLPMSANRQALLFMMLLSLGGLPPFLGFLPKWLVLSEIVSVGNPVISVSLIVFSLLTLFYYLRLTLSAFTLSKNINYTSTNNKDMEMKPAQVALTMLSLFGFSMFCMV